MQWYVYLISIPAGIVLGQLALALINRPIATVFSLRRHALERMLFFKRAGLPKPRELAVSSQDIRAYNQAVINQREARRTFADLGAQLLALSESEPTLRLILTLFGLSIVRAGQELINLSEVYAMTKTDNTELRYEIERATIATRASLTISRNPSRHDLMKIRLEPMYLCDASRNNGVSGGRSPPIA